MLKSWNGSLRCAAEYWNLGIQETVKRTCRSMLNSQSVLTLGSVVFSILLFIWSVRVYNKRKISQDYYKKKLDKKVAIITEASEGVGKVIARDLASRGAKVILACKNMEKGMRVANDILCITANRSISVKHLDLSNFSSVRQFAEAILRNESKLHILVNCSCSAFSVRRDTTEGLEMTMAANYFGHFLLTNLLTGLLTSSSPSRIINISFCPNKDIWDAFDIENLDWDKRHYEAYSAFCQSQICNALFSSELARKLQGTGVTSNSFHPNFIVPKIWARTRSWLAFMRTIINILTAKDEVTGAQTAIYLAVADEVQNTSGEYFEDFKESGRSSFSEKDDVVLGRKLWEISEAAVRLTLQEVRY